MNLQRFRRTDLALGFRRLWAAVVRARAVDFLWVGAWGLLAVGLEVLGRISPSDVVDGAGVLVLAGALVLLSSMHTGTWTAVRRRLRAALSRFRGRWKVLHGLDLRRDPALAPGWPVRHVVLLAVTLGLLLGAWFLRHGSPGALRELLRSTSGLVYLVLLAGLWGALGAGMLFSWFGVYGLLGDALGEAGARRGRPRGRRSRALGGTWLGLAVAAALAAVLPVEVGLAVVAGTTALYALVMTTLGSSLRLVWRYAERKGVSTGAESNRGGRWGPWDAAVVVWLGALVGILTLVTNGDRLGGFAQGSSATAATALLGIAFLWSAAVFFPLLLAVAGTRLALARLSDPSRPVAPRLWVERAGELSRRERRRVRADLADGGLRWVEGRGVADCTLELVTGAAPPEGFDPPRWPLAVDPGRLGDPAVRALLHRRAQVQRRRELVRRLATLFKHAARRGDLPGEGFWVAPHLWFVTHLTRDGSGEEFDGIGPPYRRTLSRAARSHFHEVMRAVDVDLIFLEDGVGFRRFKRVLALVFEHYDLFGERRLEDERHFSGLPGVRVLLHDLELAEPLASQLYPEPDYDDLGRARILHVFRDRSGDTPDFFDPSDFETRPAPSVPAFS